MVNWPFTTFSRNIVFLSHPITIACNKTEIFSDLTILTDATCSIGLNIRLYEEKSEAVNGVFEDLPEYHVKDRTPNLDKRWKQCIEFKRRYIED